MDKSKELENAYNSNIQTYENTIRILETRNQELEQDVKEKEESTKNFKFELEKHSTTNLNNKSEIGNLMNENAELKETISLIEENENDLRKQVRYLFKN